MVGRYEDVLDVEVWNVSVRKRELNCCRQMLKWKSLAFREKYAQKC